MSEREERCPVCEEYISCCVCDPTEPQDDDLVTKDRIRFYRYGFGHKGPCVVVSDPEEGWQDAVRRYMDKTSYWPDVWIEEERGGYTNITTEEP
jgi:hypothetical protein